MKTFLVVCQVNYLYLIICQDLGILKNTLKFELMKNLKLEFKKFVIIFNFLNSIHWLLDIIKNQLLVIENYLSAKLLLKSIQNSHFWDKSSPLKRSSHNPPTSSTTEWLIYFFINTSHWTTTSQLMKEFFFAVFEYSIIPETASWWLLLCAFFFLKQQKYF